MTEENERNKEQRQYDGRANFRADDDIEALLDAHFERHEVSRREVCRNFQIYSRRVFLKRFIAHYELFRRTIELPGDIVEFGVYRGASLMSWANFLEVRSMGDRAKQVIGFDNWKGFTEFAPEDGAEDLRVNKVIGGYDGGDFKDILEEAIEIYDKDRFIPYKPRIVLVDGNIEESLPASSRSTRACVSACCTSTGPVPADQDRARGALAAPGDGRRDRLRRLRRAPLGRREPRGRRVLHGEEHRPEALRMGALPGRLRRQGRALILGPTHRRPPSPQSPRMRRFRRIVAISSTFARWPAPNFCSTSARYFGSLK